MIKSQHELNTCNDGNRGSEVLVSAIEKCEVLEKENKQFRQLLKECKEWFECFAWNKEYKHKSVKILERINTVIGESEEK